MNGVAVPYEEVAGVRMDESALEFIVEQKPRTFATTGVIGGSPRQHLRMYSRSEFDLWREALCPKVINPDLVLKNQSCASITPESTASLQVIAAKKWLANAEASTTYICW